ncbi:MAG: NUDIX domain-containing protein [Verrucomicrobiales bacterium]
MQNIILDWSGTLANDLAAVVEATNAVLAEYQCAPLSQAEFQRRFRLPFDGFWDELLPGTPLDVLEESYHRHFDPIQQCIALLPGAAEFLDQCRQDGRHLFLLSTIKPQHFEKQWAQIGLGDVFEHAYTGIMNKVSFIESILTNHHLHPGETIYVGDMHHDIEAAHAGGVGAVAVLSGFDSLEKILPARPDVIFPSVRELGHWLSRNEQACRWRKPVSTVGALIFNSRTRRILLVKTKKWSGKWGIPGGKVERGETSMDALIRELEEETGLRPSRVEFVMCQDCIDSQEFCWPAHFVLLNYLAYVDSEEVRLNNEATEFCWCSPTEAFEKLDLNEPTKVLLETVLSRQMLST